MIELSVWDTALSAAPLLLGIVFYFNTLKHGLDLSVACARMVLQLLMVGYFLTFLFLYRWSWLGLVILGFMTLVAASIVIRPLRKKSWLSFYCALLSLVVAGVFHLFWMLVIVLKLDPWYQPELVIPLAGMIFASCMNSLSVGAERVESECNQSNPQAISVTAAFKAAMIPQVNSLLAMGLVALPGMMTGQILSGVPPLEAVRYQIMIMSSIVGGSIMSLSVYFFLYQRFSSSQT